MIAAVLGAAFVLAASRAYYAGVESNARKQSSDLLDGRPASAAVYYCGLSQKIPLFIKLRGQLRLVVVGDCRASYGIDPRLFYPGTATARAVAGGDANWLHPMAINLSIDSIGFDVQETLLTEYVPHAPNLEWIVFQISPRLFNRYYQDGGIDGLKNSPGYNYDVAHRDELWDVPDESIEAWDVQRDSPHLAWGDVTDPQGLCRHLSTQATKDTPSPQRRMWEVLSPQLRSDVQQVAREQLLPEEDRDALLAAFNDMIDSNNFYQSDDFKTLPLTPEIEYLLALRNGELSPDGGKMLNRLLLEAAFPNDIGESSQETDPWGWHKDLKANIVGLSPKELLAQAQTGRYEFAQDRWDQFQRIIDLYARRHVKILAVIAPMHYAFAQAPDADNDGTPDAAYWALMTRFKDLELTHPNFYFCDMHRDGRNDFTDAEYYDWDHLNVKGSKKLSARLEAIRKEIDARPRLDITSPAVTSVTAVGDPAQVSVAFSKPVIKTEAVKPANYVIDRSVAVKAVRLAPDMRTAFLETSPLDPNVKYALTVRNVKDASGNVIAQAAAPFTFAKALTIRDTSRENYAWGTLLPGAPVYVDDSIAFDRMPPSYVGLKMLKTAEADKAAGGNAFLTFDADYPVRVYVAHDDTVLALPSWMDSFTWTWDFLQARPPSGGQAGETKFRIAWKDFPAGKITLGGNAGPNGHMYAVLVAPLGDVKASPSVVAKAANPGGPVTDPK